MTDSEGTQPAGHVPSGVPAPSDAAHTDDRAFTPTDMPADDRRPRTGAERQFDVPMDTGQLHSLPTGQLLTVHRSTVVEPVEIDDDESQRRVYSGVALVLGILGMIASLFVGWMLPLSIAAIVFAVLSLRREEGARTRAFIAIAAGVTGIVFSAVWIGYYAIIFEALPS